VRASPSEVDALLDADYQEIGASGRLWTRASIIEALVEEPAVGALVEASDMQGREVTPDLILLTYVTTRDGRRARRSSLWRRTDSTWRVLFHQGTPSDL
jgi:hypothetical protein